MSRKITVEEAEKLLAQIPSMRATFLGLVMGIFLALIAQLLFKPLEIEQQHIGNFTIYLGKQPIGESTITNYFLGVVGLFGLGCFVYWIVQMRVIGLTQRTFQEVQHNIAKDDMENFVSELDRELARMERYGYEVKKYPGEPGTFTRGIRLSGKEEDSVSMRIRPLVAIIESDIDRLSLEAAKRAIDSISSSSFRTQYRHLRIIYFTRGATPINPIGPRIVVNDRTLRAYHMTSELDELARQGFVECQCYPDEDYHDWARNMRLELIERPPTKTELIS